MNTIKSDFLSLSKNDFVKALVMAVLTPIVAYVGQILVAFSGTGSFSINWTTIGQLALTGFVAYLAKQFGTNSQGLLAAEPTSSEPLA